MTAPALVKCSKCGELMMPHRVCKNCGSYNKKEIIPQDYFQRYRGDPDLPGLFFV